MKNKNVDPKLVTAYKTIVDYFNRDGDLSRAEMDNLEDTPMRCARAMSEMCLTKETIRNELLTICSTAFPTEFAANTTTNGIVLQSPIRASGLCPHHLLPVFLDVSVAYMPSKDGVVLGLSKIARIVKSLSKRPVLQEQLCKDIADVFYRDGSSNWFPQIPSQGSAVSIVARHSCMECRGVESPSYTATTEVRGIFLDNASCKAEYYGMLDRLDRKPLS